MRILHLTAGTGRWHCGTCIRDDALVKALRALGHEADLVPMYLPVVADGISCSAGERVQISGVNAWLQQEVPLFRHLPRWMDAPLASRPVLDLAGRFAGSTRPESLGAMTVSMLQGLEGHQAKEIGRLVDALRLRPAPDVVVLSNSLLVGLAQPLRDALGVPVVVTVQGELHFLDALDEGRDEAWALVAEGLARAEGVVAVSGFAADAMAARTGLPRDRFDVVHNGIDVEGYGPLRPPEGPPVLGAFARLYPAKGLHLLVDVYLRLLEQGRDLDLHLGGTLNPGDRPELDEALQRLHDAGVAHRVQVAANLSAEEKRAFLAELTVFCVPSLKDETFGMYNLEAMATGLPVVAPRRGAIPEVLERAGAGTLVAPGDAEAFVAAIGRLLDDAALRHAQAERGRRGVRAAFTSAHMAAGLADLLQRVLAVRAA
ncbi:MAG: glycosyltransferase family 4 protein [Alphaproteobacteria bacterium]|nr:glycosyltransferase family 4 protein [Alphaproteobacteria bacterium]